MIEVEKLFGIEECEIQRVENVSVISQLTPSDGVLKALSCLPKGALVGIEDASYWEREIHNVGRTPYWNYLTNNAGNASFVYLDDLSLRVEAADFFKRARIRTELKLSNPGDCSLDNEIFEFRFNAYYTHTVLTSDHILRMIKETRPLIVILDGVRADLFWSGYAESHGVKFGSYSKESPPIHREGCPVEDNENLVPNELFAKTAYELGVMSYYFTLIRRKKAIDEHRISDDKPDFLGTIDLTVPLRGLFELTVKKRKGTFWSGSIVDALGNASFVGYFDRDRAEFTRHYGGLALLLGAPKGNIAYKARRDGNKYVGTFIHPAVNGNFEMKEFK